jgi:nucleoid-associated protein YgaU
LALATLAAATLFFHRMAPPGGSDLPAIVDTPEVAAGEDAAYLRAVVGYDRNPVRELPPPTTEPTEEKVRKSIDGDSEVVRDRDRNGVILIRVRRGETLASLARTHLGDANLWKAILEANPELARPEDLQVGQELRIPLREGR